MTQPYYVVPPNPERAQWLRQLQIPVNMPQWAAFRDHELDTAQNGLTEAQEPDNMRVTLDKLIAAQLETISVVTKLQKGVQEFAETMHAAGPKPIPGLANAVRNVEVPQNWRSGVAFRDYLLNMYETGAAPGQGLSMMWTLVDRTALALLETIFILASKVDHQL